MRSTGRAVARWFGRGDAALIVVAAVVAWRTFDPGVVRVSPVSQPQPALASSSVSRATLTDSLDAAVRRLAESDPFMMNGGAQAARLATVSAAPASTMAALPGGMVGIPLTAGAALKAVAGPPWTAVVAGLPGQSGQSVLMIGDTAGGYRVTAIHSDTVILRSRDSTLRLALPRETR